jgi:hypothetical protein
MRRAPATFGILAILVLLPYCLHYFYPATAELDSCKILREAIRKQDELNDAAIESVVADLGPLDRSKCLAFAVQRPPLPHLSAVPGAGAAADLTEAPLNAEQEIYAAIEACAAKGVSDELPSYEASAKCAALRVGRALEKINYPNMDLVALFNARHVALFKQRDRNEVDQAYTAREQSRLIREFVSGERFRNGPADGTEKDRLLLRGIALGLDSAIFRRDPACVTNELRPECVYDRKRSISATILIQDYAYSSKGPFFLDWSPVTLHCFVVNAKPADRTIIGGGPFLTFGAALAAAQTVMGCRPTGQVLGARPPLRGSAADEVPGRPATVVQ